MAQRLTFARVMTYILNELVHTIMNKRFKCTTGLKKDPKQGLKQDPQQELKQDSKIERDNSNWFQSNLDCTRDRKPKKNKTLNIKRKNHGGRRQHSQDLKTERLTLQSGTEDIFTHLYALRDFVVSQFDKAYYTLTLDFLEYLILFIYDLFRMTSFMDCIAACAHFIKHHTKASLLDPQHLDVLRNLLVTTDLQSGGSDFLNDFRDLLTNWERCKNAPILRKLSRVLIYCTTFGFYSGPLGVKVEENIKRIEEQFHNNTIECCNDFLFYMLELLHYVLNKGYAVTYDGADIKTFFVNDMSYDHWLDKAQDLTSKADYMSNPGAYGLDLHTYLSDLKSLTIAGKEIYKFACELDSKTKSYVRKTLYDLQRIEMRILSQEASQATRPVPFVIVLEGDSGVGKSKVAECIHVYFGKLFNKLLDGSEKFVKNATTEFWDGFRTACWSLLIDDAAMWSSGLDILDTSVMDLIRIINNIPFMPNMASLEDKGKTPFACELVVITTNDPSLKMNEYYNYPFAAARRVQRHVRVKPRNVAGEFMLDTSKAKLVDGTIPDSWTFDVLYPQPKPFGNPKDGQVMKQAVLVKEHSDLGMGELLALIRDEATAHRTLQAKVMNHSEHVRNTKLCDGCQLPLEFCKCDPDSEGEEDEHEIQENADETQEVKLQFGETYVYSWFEMLVFHSLHIIIDKMVMYGIFACLTQPFYRYFRSHYRQLLSFLKADATEYLQDTMSTLKPHKNTIFYASVISALILAYKMYSKINLQGADFSTWGNTYPEMNERESTWRKEPQVVDTLDSHKKCLSWKGKNVEQVAELFKKNTAFMRILVEPGKWRFCRLINIVGQQYITPNHCIPTSENLECQVIKGSVGQNFSDSHRFFLNQSQVKRYPDKEICMIYLPTHTNGKDIRDYFIKKSALRKGPAFYMTTEKDKSTSIVDIPYLDQNVVAVPELKKSFDVWSAPDVNTSSGYCGAMVCRLDDMGFRILGLHQSQTEGCTRVVANSLIVTHEFIMSLPCDREIDITKPQLGFGDEDVDLAPIADNSAMRAIPNGTALVYGKLGFTNRPRSKVAKTLLYPSMKELDFPDKYGKPVMNSLKPWIINLTRQVEADSYANWDIIVKIRDTMVDEWVSMVPEDSKKELKVLDFHTVVNGKAGVRYIDSVNRSTSAGHPWKKPKRKLMFSIPCEPGEDHMEFDQTIMDRVRSRLDHYLNSTRTFPVFRASLKDEATKFEKIAQKKTRVFMGAPVDFTIATRSVLLSFIRVVQKNKFVFESAPGIEAQCIEWDILHSYLTEYGSDRMIFGDFSGFDVTMRSNFMIAAFQAIEEFHRRCGASEEQCTMIRALSFDIVFPLVEYNGDLIQLNGKNPSGQPLTAPINGIVNCMYMRYCYYVLGNQEISTFRQFVKLITYGDDNGMGVKAEIPWFNHTSITEVLSTIGVTYTMADKTSTSLPYIPISEADFLKRSWRFEEALGAYVCPLSLDSIYKSLMLGIKSAAISRQEHAENIIRSAHEEFFWHGREVFKEWTANFEWMISQHELQKYFEVSLLTWDEMCDRYHERSKSFTISTTLQSGTETMVRMRRCVRCGFTKMTTPFDYCVRCHSYDHCMICFGVSRRMRHHENPSLDYCDDCHYTFVEGAPICLLKTFSLQAAIYRVWFMHDCDLRGLGHSLTQELESAHRDYRIYCFNNRVPGPRTGDTEGIGYAL